MKIGIGGTAVGIHMVLKKQGICVARKVNYKSNDEIIPDLCCLLSCLKIRFFFKQFCIFHLAIEINILLLSPPHILRLFCNRVTIGHDIVGHRCG